MCRWVLNGFQDVDSSGGSVGCQKSQFDVIRQSNARNKFHHSTPFQDSSQPGNRAATAGPGGSSNGCATGGLDRPRLARVYQATTKMTEDLS